MRFAILPRMSTATATAAAQNGGAAAAVANKHRRPHPKTLWLQTGSQAALTAALESGVTTVVFDSTPAQAQLAAEWQQLGRFDALVRTPDDRLLLLRPGGGGGRGGGSAVGVEAGGEQVGRVRALAGPEDLRAAEREAAAQRGTVVIDASDWQVGGVG